MSSISLKTKSDKNTEIMSKFTKGLFWNFDFEKMNYLRDKKMIIERIIDAGVENDEIIMWKTYSYKDIKNIALNMENLHPDIVTYMSFVLKVKESNFKCYKKKQWYQK